MTIYMHSHFVHDIVLIAYIIIALQASLAFIKRKKKADVLPLLLMSLIFVLCALTRFFMEKDLYPEITVGLNLALLIISVWFVLTNQMALIIERQKDDQP